MIDNVKSSQADKDHDISEKQSPEQFEKGSLNADLNLMYDRLNEFNEHVKDNHKKIEIYRKVDTNNKPLYTKLKNVVAIVTNDKISTKLPIFKLEEIEKIARFILNNCKKWI